MLLERNDFSSNHHPALDLCLSMIFFRKPVPTFRDHALKPFLRREGVGNEVAQQRRARERIELNAFLAQFRNAGIFNLAVNKHHAFLADIRIETAETYGEIGILVKSDADEPIEDGISILKRDLEFLIAPAFSGVSTPDFQMRRPHARAACTVGCASTAAKLETSRP